MNKPISTLIIAILLSCSVATMADDGLSTDAPATLDVGILQRTLTQSAKNKSQASVESELPLAGLKRLGFSTQAHYYSYPRLVRALLQGAVGAGSILRYNGNWMAPKPPQFSCHKKPYLALPLSIYKLSNNDDIPDRLDHTSISKFTVGYMRSIAKDIDPFINQPNFVPANNMQTLFKMLKNHRLDTVFADTAITASWSRRLNIEVQPIMQLGKLESFFCFSHMVFGEEQAQYHSDAFYNEMLKLKSQGFIDQFLNQNNIEFYRGLYLPTPPKLNLKPQQ